MTRRKQNPGQQTVYLYPSGQGHVVAKNQAGAIVTCNCFQALPQCATGGQPYTVKLPPVPVSVSSSVSSVSSVSAPTSSSSQPHRPPFKRPYRRRH